MPGHYSNAVIHVKFPELSEDPVTDPIWVAMRNPRMMPPRELQEDDSPVGDDGKPLDPKAAEVAMYKRLAKLVIGLRAYDASNVTVDELTGEPLPMDLLKPPITVELIHKLPTNIIHKLTEEYVAALDLKPDPEPPTSKTSTLSLPAYTTAPGLPEESPLNSLISS